MSPDAVAFAAEWRAWHDAHERRRAAPHGFLAVTDLQFVTATPRRFDGIPGEWSLVDGAPVVELDPALDGDDALELDGAPLAGRHAFGAIATGGGLIVGRGDRVVEIANRDGRILLRPRDPRAPLRTGHTGTPAYEPDPAWRIPGRFSPYDAPRRRAVGTALPGLAGALETIGEVEFELGGRPLRLTVSGDGDGLLAIFTDATAGITTSAQNRMLEIDAPGPDGAVVLDFTRTTNFPCAYTDFATCPLPPAENRLPVAIEAGEQLPLRRLDAATPPVPPR